MANVNRGGRPPAPAFIINPALVLTLDQSLQELENITHRTLVEQTREDIIEWLARHGLIHNEIMCPNCNVPCRLRVKNQAVDGKRWTCQSPNCNFSKSIRADSFFDNSHLSFTQIVDIIYLWSKKLSLTYIMEETGIEDWGTAVDWANFIRDICGFWYLMFVYFAFH